MAARRNMDRRETQYFVDGNTVRKAVPERRPSRQQEIKQRRKRRARQERALHMNLPYVVVLTAAVICSLGICVDYLHVQSSMAKQMDDIKKIEQDLENLRAENDAAELSINASIDLDYIYKVATEELGMVYANKEQVILYDKTESEYIKQYEDVPKR
ncbi:septum formation initiator family protein [Lachnospiraceae bacterium 62-35]